MDIIIHTKTMKTPIALLLKTNKIIDTSIEYFKTIIIFNLTVRHIYMLKHYIQFNKVVFLLYETITDLSYLRLYGHTSGYSKT
jgi:hypothetical protein